LLILCGFQPGCAGFRRRIDNQNQEVVEVSRRRPAGPDATLGFGAIAVAIMLLLGTTGGFAQTAPEDLSLSRPEDNWGPGHPPRFQKKVPVYGNPAGFGAGKSGFDSTNYARSKAAKGKAKSVARPLPPVTTGRVTPIALPSASYAPSFLPSGVPAAAIKPPRRKLVPETDPYDALGIRAGSFLLRPAIDLTGGYDTNPGRSTDAAGSSFLLVAPELLVRSDWSRHDLRADLRGSYSSFSAQPSLNRPYFESKIDGRVDVSSQTWIDLQNRFLLSTDNPGSPNLQASAVKAPIFTTLGGTVGVGHRFNRLEVSAKGGIDRTRYDNSVLTDGTTSSNADRDLYQYGLQLRAGYEFKPGLKPFVQLDADSRVHDLDFDRTGVQRDSKGFSPRIGTTFEFTRILTGQASIGYVVRRYKDPSLSDLRGLVADASLVWAATPVTTATLTARSSADETTVAGVSGVLTRDFGLQVDHSFRRWLTGTVKLGYGFDDYVVSDALLATERQDRRYSASAALTYKLTRMLWMKGEARQEWRRSNQPGQDYKASIFLIGIRLQR
jgi:hypothetical protein